MATLYKSECGQYLCRPARDWGHFEAWTNDGALHWKDDDRCKTFADERNLFPLEHCVIAFHAERTGQKRGSFTLTMARCDTTKKIVPFTGNTIIESNDIVFRRKVPPQNYPRFLRDK